MRAPNMWNTGEAGSLGSNAYHVSTTAGCRSGTPRNILVTGGAGYIGSHACKALAGSGFCPVVVDNLVSGHAWAVKWGPLIVGDLNDRDLLAAIMKEYRISAVMHFAAYAYVGESMKAPGKYFYNNVANSLNLLDAMVAADVDRMVFSSSCATYGVPHQLPISETHPQHPINPYGESKLFVERMLYWYGQAHGLRACALRYFNAAGDDPDGQIGEDHNPETHLIPLVIQTALGQRDQITVFGTDYDTPDGTAVRDYVHVRDLAEAHVLAIKRLLDGQAGCFLNLGTGVGHSVRDIVAAVERASGLPVNTVNAPRRPGDPAILVAEPGAAAEILGWIPRYSDLDTLVGTALDWHAKQAPMEPVDSNSADVTIDKGVKPCSIPTLH